jgi:exosortase
VILGSLALPLQFKASQLGTAMLASRHIPVLLEGNVIHLPDRSLFVAEACSGLRSLTALLALAVLAGGLWLRTPGARLFLVAAAVPIAVFLNGLRIFLTGFLVYFLNPAMGDGFLHYTEGWAIFVVAFGLLCLLAAALGIVEGRLAAGRTPTNPAAAA